MRQTPSDYQEHRRFKGQQALLLAIILLALAFAGGSRYGQYLFSAKNAASLTLAEQEEAVLAVHVKGAVERPGVYWFQQGQRLIDAVEAAGALAEADLSAINLAAYIKDGQELYVPTVDEAENTPVGLNSQGQVNINSADSQQLQTLSGIGPTKAEAIIAYREQHGPFTSVEQLLQVSGIGQATLAQIQDHVCAD